MKSERLDRRTLLTPRLRRIEPTRVRLQPIPGTATEADLNNGLCELIDGTLVEKAVGAIESSWAGDLVFELKLYLKSNPIGWVYLPDCLCRVGADLLGPDVSFVSKARLPGGPRSAPRILPLAPDLVVEFVSPSNTNAELLDTRRAFFTHGTRLLWEFEPGLHAVRVFTDAETGRVLTIGNTLDGGEVLPNFRLNLADFFHSE